MKGERIDFRPGWDCHGLPIEVKALASTESGRDTDPMKIRSLCRQFALEAVEKQASVMRSWGLLADYDRPYLTMQPEFEANQLNILAAMLERNLISSARKPVHFSPSSRTALAEAELEYNDKHVSLTTFIKFKAHLDPVLRNRYAIGNDVVYFTVWTTTPWTLPANKALAVGQDISYSLVRHGNEYLIIARDRVSELCAHLQHSLQVVKADFCLGHELAQSCKYERLNFDFNSHASILGPVLLGDFVTSDSGTGIVHLAPDHGTDDYLACQTAGIGPDCDYLNDAGEFNDSAPSFLRGLNIFSGASEMILEYLKCANAHVATHYHTHRYPIDWRTKQPVIQRATRQWFVSIADILGDLKRALEDVRFIPDSGKQKMLNMLESRSAWCISRQRKWGLPIPAFQAGSELILRPELVRFFAERVRTSPNGSDIWWTDPVEALVPKNTDASNLTKTFDTLDVWFDSGTVWTNFDAPNAIYLEGSDQFRGWFQSSLITSVAARGLAPFKTVISHGFVLDAAGQKMSKSLNNVVDPQTIVDSEGSDVLRLWAASSTFTEDVTIGSEIITQTAESRRKIRNTLRFIVGNLGGYDGRELNWQHLRTIDRLAYGRFCEVINSCQKHYEAFNYQAAVHELVCYFNQDLSAFYWDILKDRLYTEAVSSPLRQSTQALLNFMAKSLAICLAPIMPHLAQEVWSHLRPETEELVGTMTWPQLELLSFDKQHYNEILMARSRFLELFSTKWRSELGVKSTFDCHVFVSGNLLDLSSKEICELLMVARVQEVEEALPQQLTDGVTISVQKSPRHRCPRCWTADSVSEQVPCPKCEQQLLQIPLNIASIPNQAAKV